MFYVLEHSTFLLKNPLLQAQIVFCKQFYKLSLATQTLKNAIKIAQASKLLLFGKILHKNQLNRQWLRPVRDNEHTYVGLMQPNNCSSRFWLAIFSKWSIRWNRRSNTKFLATGKLENILESEWGSQGLWTLVCPSKL